MSQRLSPQQSSRVGASPEAIIAHYDTGNEFFRLWLGPENVYSCALFEEGDDLDAAQMRKLDHHIDAAAARGVDRVLEIGCGWGGLLRRLVKHAGVKHAVGLTLSPAQARWIREGAPPGIEVREEDWRDHKPDRPYDAVISIAAFEAFAHYGIDPAAKLQAYREFFALCHRVLADGGRLSIQTIAYVKPVTDVPSEIVKFYTEKIFPESELPLIWEPIAAADGLFELLALRNDSDHYFRTLRIWERNLVGCYDEAVALIGEIAVKNFRQYLRLSAAGFKLGKTNLLRMSFRKIS